MRVYLDKSIELRVWELIAYLGRYAGQPANVCLKLTLRQLHLLSNATGRIVKQENTPATGS